MRTTGRTPRPLALACLGATSLLAGLVGCGDDHDHGDDVDARPADAAPGSGAVTVAFAHRVGGDAVLMGTDTPYLNAAGDAFGVTVVRYFVSDVSLHFADGSRWDAPGPRYVDHELTATLTQLLASDVPTGALASVSFVMGLPPALNTSGRFTAPPESLMEWPEMMGGGYHYLKFEGRYLNEAGEPFPYRAHSGGLDGVDYSFAVSLDASGRAVEAAGTTLTLVMNLEQWFTAPHTWDLDDYFNAAQPGIMRNATAQAELQANGATVFALGAP